MEGSLCVLLHSLGRSLFVFRILSGSGKLGATPLLVSLMVASTIFSFGQLTVSIAEWFVV
jgi:hypothetical protein